MRDLKNGRIEVICGPMFAGKTEELLRRVRRLEFAKKKVLLFKPQIDNRYMTNCIVSHDQNHLPSIQIVKSDEILKYIDDEVDAIAIDEVQFLDKEVINICNRLASKGILVIVSGLDKDFRNEPFGFMPNFFAIAEKVTKLSAVCVVCGEPATCTQRIIDGRPANYNDKLILVGATESYEARCRHCHIVVRDK